MPPKLYAAIEWAFLVAATEPRACVATTAQLGHDWFDVTRYPDGTVGVVNRRTQQATTFRRLDALGNDWDAEAMFPNVIGYDALRARVWLPVYAADVDDPDVLGAYESRTIATDAGGAPTCQAWRVDDERLLVRCDDAFCDPPPGTAKPPRGAKLFDGVIYLEGSAALRSSPWTVWQAYTVPFVDTGDADNEYLELLKRAAL
jgi:hypothetical protein